jgi:hypothetical protein
MRRRYEADSEPYANLMLPVGMLFASGGAAYVLFATSWSLGRAIVTAAAVCLGPGLALVPLARLDDLLLKAVLVVLASVAIDICVAQAVTYTSGFTWQPCAIALVAICAIGAVLQLLFVFSLRRQAQP